MPTPAPARFTDLREQLHTGSIDAVYISLTLEQYLALPDNMSQHDWLIDPQEDHQAWQYRENISQFMSMITESDNYYFEGGLNLSCPL
jgi:hypothetical protein